MDIIKTALIGYGYVGKTFHAPLIRAISGLDLTVVSSSDAAKVKADLPDVRVEASAHSVISDPAIDLVVIASPNDTHFPLAREALLAGKHVVIDKPFTVNLQEARDLVALASRVGRQLSVFHNRRWDSDFLGVKQTAKSGALGRLAHIETRFDRYRPAVRDRWRERAGEGAGLWFDIGPHLIDQILQLCGLPDKVLASMAKQRDGAMADDWAHVVLEYGRGRAVLNCSVLAAGGMNRFMVHGDKASVVKRFADPQEAQLRAGMVPGSPDWGRDPDELILIDGEGQEQTLGSPKGDYRLFYAGVADAIRGHGDNPVPMPQALAVMAVLEAAIEAAVKGKSVMLPLSTQEKEQFEACTLPVDDMA
jgi:predicted dehydrogenase